MKLNILSLVGLLLLAAGVAFLLGVGIPGQETVLEVGEFRASVDRDRAVSPWIAGVLAFLGVAAMAVGQMAGRRQR